MPALRLAFGASKRTGFTEIPTVNCLAEKDPTDPEAPLALIARPGLEELETVGTAPIRALFQKDGLFDEAALLVVSGEVITLSSAGTATTLTGASVSGDDLVDIDAGLDADLNSIARIANGSKLYKVLGGVVSEESFPSAGNNVGATSVAFVGGYWVAVEAGTDSFYYQNPAETTWNALQFASAEYAPDKLKGVRVVGELICLLGSSTFEGWRLTGDAGSPLEPFGGLKFDIGCRSLPSAVNCRGVLIWVDSSCGVRMFSGGEPRLISDNGLSEQIRSVDPDDIRASFFVKDGHPVYSLTLGVTATWLYDLSTEIWTRATSDGMNYWRAHLFCNIGDTVMAADAVSNQVWTLDPDRETDGSDTFTMEFCAFVPAKEAPVAIANVELHCEVGGSPLSGQGSSPLVVMQISRDRGKTYVSPRERGLGATGEYTTRVRWNACGQAPAPFGAILKFHVSDPVTRRVSAVYANTP